LAFSAADWDEFEDDNDDGSDDNDDGSDDNDDGSDCEFEDDKDNDEFDCKTAATTRVLRNLEDVFLI